MLLLILALQDLTLDDGARVTRVPSVRVRVKGAPGVEMSLTTDEKAAPVWTPWREISILDLPGGDGDKKVWLRLRDVQGVESAPVSASIRLDTTPPLPKAEAPERVAGSEVRAAFDVPDAVALRYAEDVRSWSSWEPYSTPKTLPLSKGAGPKALFVQFRDEAGNESVPARIVVEAQSAAPSPAAGLRSLVLGARRVEFGLWLTLWLDGAGLTEARVSLDGVEILARTAFQPRWTFEVGRADGPRRLLVTAWDAANAEHRGEAVFQDRDAPEGTKEDTEKKADERSLWNVGLLAGYLPRGISMEAETSGGRREIEEGGMPFFRAEARLAPVYPLVVGLAAEWTEGEDVRVLSIGADAGVRFDLGTVAGTEIEAGIDFGAYFSTLQADPSDFGDFKPAVLTRGGVRLGIRVTEDLWAEVAGEMRWASYDLDEHTLGGGEVARLRGAGLMAGISWRF